LLGGDFNLVRKIEEKSSGNVDLHMMDAFNEMINLTELREIQRTSSRFTWSNKQTPPIMCVLDRVLVSNSWEDKYNLISVLTAPRVGSDHNPFILDTRVIVPTQQCYFRFSSHWLNQDGFREWVIDKWPIRYKFDILDHWHILSSKIKRAIKGWEQNLDSHQRRAKQDLMSRINLLDEWSDNRDL